MQIYVITRISNGVYVPSICFRLVCTLHVILPVALNSSQFICNYIKLWLLINYQRKIAQIESSPVIQI